MKSTSKSIGFIESTWLTLLHVPRSSYQEFLLIFNTYFRWYLVCCYFWLWILNILLPDILLYFIKATSNMQPRSQGWWLQFIVTAKGKGDTTKEKNMVYCCYQDMVSPIYDQSYDEGLQEDRFWWKLWAGAYNIDIYQ